MIKVLVSSLHYNHGTSKNSKVKSVALHVVPLPALGQIAEDILGQKDVYKTLNL